jgi:hypothetical protein
MGQRTFLRLAFLPVALAFPACADQVCLDYAVIGIEATVEDASTGAAIVPTLAVASEGSYADTLFHGGGGRMLGVEERAGTYRLEVTAPGYVFWFRQGIRVIEEDGCHVRTTNVVVRMTPQ